MPCIFDSRPLSLGECVKSDGKADPAKIFLYFQRRDDEDFSFAREVDELLLQEDDPTEEERNNRGKRSFCRSTKKVVYKGLTPDGDEFEIAPTTSVWYIMYVNALESNLRQSQFRDKFRRRFRMPYK